MFESLSIIIPSYNGIKALQSTVLTLQKNAPEAEIVVVDGGSTDGSKEWLAQQGNIVLHEVKNFGYAHAINRGCEIARNDILVLMNSDVLLEQPAIKMMQQRLLEHQGVAAVGVVPLQTDGKKQQSFGGFAWYFSNYFRVLRPMRVKVLHGYCIATRRDVLERLGGFDENFFFYNEEFDWCWRVRKAGLHLEMLPESAIHVGGSSTVQSPELMFEGHRGGMYLANKHFPGWQSTLIRRFFQGIAWVMGFFDKRQEYRQAWRKLEDCMKRGAYLETPFALSGRGEVRFKSRAGQSN